MVMTAYFRSTHLGVQLRARIGNGRRDSTRQPQIKLPSFDGTGHIDELLIPFERLA